MSKPFMISYDLDSPGQKYEDLKNCIEKDISGPWCHYEESLYLLRSSLTPYEMIKKLKPFLDSNDSVIITEITKNWSGWVTKKQRAWINEHIFID
ncbi:hypothetical protein ACQ7C6_12320 [Lactiplantibacillus plantarum]|uniref:hypothetical protein n=1 Tax=Lactiplantibacillus TaxID=2767842 RepID=UPI000D017DF3|nr:MULTISPECIES: hypothetical protein [Lactiplantibacillus]MCC3164270.1 hypothetical protein [Lactiplantibacillus pentosus]MCJ8180966.1 hypothetical protein [Lactiplantibacillus pentosus]MCJ8189400.1 hypothetical protein [Lactiplantibacillus pentosus]MCT3304800.1 hypothetical protein [Lactiplantibacillus pentosus]MDO7794973.1 hypothetical protein [Lactiplantibacillus plantarum]